MEDTNQVLKLRDYEYGWLSMGLEMLDEQLEQEYDIVEVAYDEINSDYRDDDFESDVDWELRYRRDTQEEVAELSRFISYYNSLLKEREASEGKAKLELRIGILDKALELVAEKFEAVLEYLNHEMHEVHALAWRTLHSEDVDNKSESVLDYIKQSKEGELVKVNELRQKINEFLRS